MDRPEPEPMETEESDDCRQDNNNHLDAKEKKKKKLCQNKEKQRENNMTSGNLFITTFMDLLEHTKASRNVFSHYMERVLHSIFFFGYINSPPISPCEFLPGGRDEILKSLFPKPFEEYNTHLPRYTPYSILLEYMTKRLENEDLDSLLKELLNINKSLLKSNDKKEDIANEYAFNASAVTFCCVKDSNNANVLKKAYGSSMSCQGKTQRRIMIAISALHVWDRAVSYAVCCAGKGPPITFPKRVQCTTHSFTQKNKIPPCNKCFKMYIVAYNPEHEAHNRVESWEYGNCAENESLSRLLHSDEDVRKEVCVMGENGQKLMNRQDIEKKFRDDYEDKKKKEGKNLLGSRKFKLPAGEWNFFTPQSELSS